MPTVPRIEPAPGQESVWDYPRPPRLERVERRVRVVFAGVTVVDSTHAFRVLETSHPPVFYVPPSDVRIEWLTPAPGSSFCEWKGRAVYWTLAIGDRRAEKVAWSYPDPSAPFGPLRDHLAFYASRVDACFVGDEPVTPQPGGFYGGWITREIVGPFKGGPGSAGW